MTRGEAVLASMNETLARRGPDDAGWFVGAVGGVAMRRLSIQDVEGGHQPIFNEDHTVCVVFNGEIYNQRELRRQLLARGHHLRTKSDTEVIVHLYEDYGEGLVTHLQGMFAFAVYDTKKQVMLLARDRLGIKPLFYAERQGVVFFASEIKALTAVAASDCSLDVQALDAFFAYGYIPSPLTIYRNVKKLDPGHTIMVSGSGMSGRRYWDVRFGAKEQLPEDEWIDRLDSTLRSVVSSHLISDVPVGAFLSGGVDSGLVSAMASSALDYPLETFTIGFDGSSNGVIDERGYARQLATRYAFVHQDYSVRPNFESVATEILNAFDEPFADDSVIPSYYVAREAAKSVKVVLSGLGGDELFGGYQRHLGFQLSSVYQYLPSALHRYLLAPLIRRLPEPRGGGDRVDHLKRFAASAGLPAAQRYVAYVTALNRRERRALYHPDVARQIDFDYTETLLTNHFTRCDSDDDLDRMFYTDLKTYLPEDILALSDRLGMWHSLEIRVPLVDHQLVELAATIPTSLKLKAGKGKRLLKRVARSYLPSDLIDHRKQGFEAPMAAWLRRDLADYARRTFEEPRAAPSLVNRSFMRAKLDEHQGGRRKNNKLLFSAIVLLLWSEHAPWSL